MTNIEITSYKCSRCGYHVITVDQVFTECPWCANFLIKSIPHMSENLKEILQKRQELRELLKKYKKD